MVKHPRYHILIDCNGDTTKAFMFVEGKCVKASLAKRNPKDKFSLRIGMETAFNRLFEKKEKEDKSQPFKVGDRVICTEAFCGNVRVKGAHGTVRTVRNDLDEITFGVEFDTSIHGHSLCGKGKFGHGWWCVPRVLKHEQEVK